MLTLIFILAIAVGIVAFVCAGFAVIGKFFAWVFRFTFELGKVCFILFIAYLIFIGLTT